MIQLLGYHYALLIAYRALKRIWRRIRELRYWGYLMAIIFSHHVGETLSIVLTANRENQAMIAEVSNGILFFTIIGFSAAYFASSPPPTEAEVLRKVARRKLAEAMVDGSEDDSRLVVWNSILENTNDETF